MYTRLLNGHSVRSWNISSTLFLHADSKSHFLNLIRNKKLKHIIYIIVFLLSNIMFLFNCYASDNVIIHPFTVGKTADLLSYEANSDAVSVAASPTSLEFGNVTVGNNSTPQTITLTNNGAENVTLYPSTATGDVTDFTVQPGGQNPCMQLPQTLAIGESCTMTATFHPVSEGTKAATLTMPSNAADAPVLTINFNGNGGAELISRGNLTGSVTYSTPYGGAHYLPGVLVSAYDAVTTSLVAQQTTDSHGDYTFAGLKEGTYRLQFTKAGYNSQWYNNASSSLYSNSAKVVASRTTTLEVVDLRGSGGVSGMVRDAATGTGMSNVLVSFYPQNQAYVFSVYTDSSGHYEVNGLAPDSYKIRFETDKLYGNYIAEWYSGTTDWFGSDNVTVDGQVTLTDMLLEPGGEIIGKVKDAVTQAPIENALVSLHGRTPLGTTTVMSAKTDSSGLYSFAGLPSGSYKISANAIYYLSQWYNSKSDSLIADLVTVTAPTTTYLTDIVLTKVGSITGKVKDELSKDSIENVTVAIYDSHTNGFVTSSRTDSSGTYSFEGLVGKDYKVRFLDGGYMSRWYNGKGDQASADVVTVTAGNTTVLADVPLTKGGAITGRVKDASTQAGIPGVSVTVFDSQNNSYVVSYAYSDSTGWYSVGGLPSGSYKMQFFGGGSISQWYNGKSDQAGAETITVTAPDATSVSDAMLSIGGSISGRVTDQSGSGIYFVRVLVYDVNGKEMEYRTDPWGNYTAAGLASGSYRLLFDGTAAGYLRQYRNNKINLWEAEPVQVIAPSSTSGIDAVLVVGGSIAGTVTDSNGQAINNVSIEVLDGNDNPISYALTDIYGKYVAKGIPSGNHKVRFNGYAKGFVNELYSGTLYLANAVPVLVTAPTQTGGIDASLSAGGFISGLVTDISGTPLSGIAVHVYDYNSGFISYAVTNADGSYKAVGIPAGTFKVAFSADSRYAAQWYGGGDFSSATPVTVSSITETSGINAQLGSGAGIFYGAAERDFGEVDLNSTSAYRAFTISNYGTENLVIDKVALAGANGAEFNLQNDNCSGKTVVPADNCTFRLFFTPASVGLKSAAVNITSNDPETPVLAIATKGVGIAIANTNPKSGDCNGDGVVSIAEVQSAINMFLGIKGEEICVDTDNNGSVSIAEVQKAIISFLGLH